MKRIIVTVFILASTKVFAQTDCLTKDDLAKELQPLKSSVQALQKENGRLKSEISNLNSKLFNALKSIDSVQQLSAVNSSAIAQTADQLGIKINNTEQTANQKIDKVGHSLTTNSLLGIIAVMAGIILSWLLYWLLSKRQKADKTEVVQQLKNTKATIEESLVKEFEKQTSLIEKELELLAKQIENPQVNNAEPDHSLALKLASEINLIERNINLMDKGTKG